jgi:uncharacterized BrkB/YihY/UPF0761 family membrane protein
VGTLIAAVLTGLFDVLAYLLIRTVFSGLIYALGFLVYSILSPRTSPSDDEIVAAGVLAILVSVVVGFCIFIGVYIARYQTPTFT